MDAALPPLSCPACGGRLAAEWVPQRDPEAGACGLLRCPCATYPVLDGVPILRRGPLPRRSISDARVVAAGPDAEAVAAAVRLGDGLGALVALLAAPVCPWPLNRVERLRRLSRRPAVAGPGLAARRRRVRRMLARRADLTAEDWLAAFYLHAPEPFDPFNYFFYRFGTPRHLATLAMAAALPPGGPVLDLASGFGHVAHALARAGHPTVGLDQNFHQAWTARHYVAPGALFVCADATGRLPFPDGAFAAALCADAFDYLGPKAHGLAELDRVAGGGPVLLTALGNALAGPPDGDPTSPDDYPALFDGWRWRARTEADLLDRYLTGLAPDLSASSADADLRAARWLSVAAAQRPEAADALLRDHGHRGGWPHARGRLALNPLYERAGGRYVLRFPSPWYEAENGGLRRYMPARLGAGDLAEADLVARAAVVGLPDRYARAGRPWTVGANRALLGAADRLRRAVRSGTAPG